MFLLGHPAIQYHSTLAVFAGPVKVRIPFVGQSLIGTVICTEIDRPGGRVPLDGLRLMPFIPLVLADQFKLTVFELLVSNTEHIQRPSVGSSVH